MRESMIRAFRSFTPALLAGGVAGAFAMLGGAPQPVDVGSAPAFGAPAFGAPVFEELEFAQLAGRDEGSPVWEVDEEAVVPREVLEWLSAKIGPPIDFRDHADRVPDHRGPLWRSLLPDGLELYVQEICFMPGSRGHRVYFLRDAASGALSTEGVEVVCRWDNTGQAKLPLRLHLARLDEHAPWQIAVRSYDHNGTFLNSERVDYLEPDRRNGRPELGRVLDMHTAMQWPFDARDGCAPDGVFASSLWRDERGLRLEHWYEHAGLGVGRRPAARGRYVREAAGEPFELVDLEILDSNSPMRR